MRKLTGFLIVATAMLGLLSGIATAAPTFLGTTGNILTPDDLALGPGDFSANFHHLALDDDATVIGASIGVTPSLELGIARFDPDARGVEDETILNVKYVLMPEAVGRPSVVIGAVDVTGDLDPDDDPGAYVVIGKNLTRVATGIAGEPSRPLRGFIGFGTGIYGGLFAGLDWTLNPTTSLMVEFIDDLKIKGTLSEDSVFNAGIRIALTDSLRADLALINGEDFGFGISYVKTGP